MKNQVILVVDDDAQITEGLSMSLEAENRTIITCRDLESAQLIVERVPLSMILSDVKLSGPFGFEGLEFIPHVGRFAPTTAIVLMTGSGTEALKEEARKRGAVAIVDKPFEVEAIEAILAKYSSGDGEPLLPEGTPGVIRIPPLQELLAGANLHTAFQPIFSLSEPPGHPLGFEALLRLKEPIPLIDPPLLFAYAERRGVVPELEFACIQRALSYGSILSRLGKLFMNIHPEVFDDRERLIAAITTFAELNHIAHDRIVLEITEQGKFRNFDRAVEGIHMLQSLGIEFAFDDVGIAYSHLALIDRIRPRYLKISQDFGTGFDLDETKYKLVRNIMSLASDFNCSVILEGIENSATEAFARRMGIPFGQGFFFTRPKAASEFEGTANTLPS